MLLFLVEREKVNSLRSVSTGFLVWMGFAANSEIQGAPGFSNLSSGCPFPIPDPVLLESWLRGLFCCFSAPHSQGEGSWVLRSAPCVLLEGHSAITLSPRGRVAFFPFPHVPSQSGEGLRHPSSCDRVRTTSHLTGFIIFLCWVAFVLPKAKRSLCRSKTTKRAFHG